MKPVKNFEISNLKLKKYSEQNKINLSNKHLQILLMIAGIGCCIGMSTPQVHIIPICMDNGYDIGIGNEILSIMLFCAVISRILFGYIADKIGPVETLLLGSILQAITLSLFIPFNDINSLKNSYNKAAILDFENLDR